jgi:cytochrome c oxidase subunit II
VSLALVLVLLVVGSVVFHFLSPWWWTPIASNWGYIDRTIIITFWITGVAFVAIIIFVAYCVFRFRHQDGREAHYEPENKKLEWWLTIITTLGVAGLLAPGLIVWQDFVTVPADATEIEVLGQQWQWNFRLPGKDGVLGQSAPDLISPDNPFGLNQNDPKAQDDILIEAADLHLLLGKPVKVLLRSKDVVHDFYVPEFRAKMDRSQVWLPFIGLPPPESGLSIFSVSSYAAQAITRCEVPSWWRIRMAIRRGCRNSPLSSKQWLRPKTVLLPMRHC